MCEKPLLNRRGFLKGTAAGLATTTAPMILPPRVRGAQGSVAPSNRIVIGCIGVGGRGKGNLRTFMQRDDVQIVAICDVDRAHRNEVKKMVEEHYAKQLPGGLYKGCSTHDDFRELINRSDIDALSIATPDHWHAVQVLEGARAGKDIYCEKPLSLTVKQGRATSNAITHYGRILQTGSQQRSDSRFRFACELARNGRLGELQRVEVGLPPTQRAGADKMGIVHGEEMPVPKGFNYDMWLGPAPWVPYHEKRCHWNFRWIYDYSGGFMTDWGAHHCDIAQWGVGADGSGPIEFEGTAEFPADGLYNTPTGFHIDCRYSNGVQMALSNKFPNGVRFEGSEGWVHVTRGRIETQPRSLLTTVIGANEIHLYESDSHHGNFLACVRTRAQTVAPAEVGHRSVSIAHLGNIALRLGRKIKWNPAKERIEGDEEAGRMLGRAMRAPWRIT